MNANMPKPLYRQIGGDNQHNQHESLEKESKLVDRRSADCHETISRITDKATSGQGSAAAAAAAATPTEFVLLVMLVSTCLRVCFAPTVAVS